MGITSLFHLIVFTHHIMSFQSSEMSVVFTKNKGGNGREREGWLLSQENLLEDQGWTPPCLPQAFGSSLRGSGRRCRGRCRRCCGRYRRAVCSGRIPMAMKLFG